MRGVALHARGWTLVELLLVLALTGGLALIAARLIESSGRMVTDLATQHEVGARGAAALERMAQEARQILPGSARLVSVGSEQYLEWVPVQASARYRAAPAQSLPEPGDILNFADPTDDRFDVLGPLTLPAAPADLVIPMADPTAGTAVYGGSHRRAIRSFTAGVLSFVPQGAWPQPAAGRFAVITGAVSWVCRPRPDGQGELLRLHGYPMNSTQPASLTTGPLSVAQRTVVLAGLTVCRLSLTGSAQQPWLTVEWAGPGAEVRAVRAWGVGPP